MKKGTIQIVLAACMVIFYGSAWAQTKEKADTATKRASTNIFHTAINALKKNNNDSAVLNAKSETPFLPYDGKGIRRIIIQEYGFEKTFNDTSKGSSYFGTRLLNNLHRNSREWVIRNNLFVHERSAFNAYIVADNERYLRSLRFIQDARILVKEIFDNPDSVDLIIITKDLFSINLDVGEVSPQRIRTRVSDVNFAGAGQSIEFSSLIDQQRRPKLGYQLLYTKNNLANTFVNATAAYTNINNHIVDGRNDEHAWYVRLDRPLVSPYSHTAGSFIVGTNVAEKNYEQSDSSFYNYKYNTIDGWFGYNLGIKNLLLHPSRRLRRFVSVRYFQNHFLRVPYQIGPHQFDPRFNSKEAILGQFTLFKQDFYKTNYIYGFGTTEDVPYGFNIAFTSGWYKQLNLERPYAGVDANRYIVTTRGEFVQYFLRTGAFLHQGRLEDASILGGMSFFSRLFLVNNMKIRQYFRLSYTRLYNRVGYDALKINNPFGLRYFSSDSVLGNRRASVHTETFFFLKRKLFGFNFAPFTFADASMLTPEGTPLSNTGFYYGLGGGIRTRNENLVFGTMEFRFIYFPRQVGGFNSFKTEININLNFRYNSSYVRAPAIIDLNSDYSNSIY